MKRKNVTFVKELFNCIALMSVTSFVGLEKNVSDLTLEDAESFLTAKRLEGRSPETHNHYRSAIKFLYKKVLKTVWDDDISRTNMTIHVRETKGRIDRYTILSQKNLDLLTEYWYD